MLTHATNCRLGSQVFLQRTLSREPYLEGNPKMSWLLVALLSTFVGSPAPDCVIVEFMVDNCRPCQQLQPALEKLKSEGWDVRTVNAERDPALVRKHSIDSLPTLLLISNGKEVDRIVGAAPYDKILPRLAKLLLISRANNSNSPTLNSSATSELSQTLNNQQLNNQQLNSLRSASSATGASTQAERTEVDPNRFGRSQMGRSEPLSEADAWQAPVSTKLPEPGITVRGQSPSGSFPMLANNAGSAFPASPPPGAAEQKFEELNSPASPSVDQLAMNFNREKPFESPTSLPGNLSNLPTTLRARYLHQPHNLKALLTRKALLTHGMRLQSICSMPSQGHKPRLSEFVWTKKTQQPMEPVRSLTFTVMKPLC